ncbi:glycosyltransferase [Candidatus Uhrbacteria bacterium]|nr:glycosyltransferase [Candidatus Uhrbacteria bacterium]
MKKTALLYFAASRPPYEQAGDVPSVIFYGTDKLREDPAFDLCVRWVRNPFLQLLCRPLETYLIARVHVGFRLDQALRHLWAIRRQEVILAETDSTGLPLLLLKRLGFIRGRVGFISAGLINELEAQQHTRLFAWYRWLLRAADFIVCWSPLEEALYRDLTGARARSVLLEADTHFYQPDFQASLGDFVLCVGRDVGRDFQTLFKALEALKIPAKVVTSRARVQGLCVPGNVELVLNLVAYPTLLDWYRQARLVVVSLQEVHRFTGQRALLEALAMGKATVVAKTLALTSTYPLDDGREVVFYEPGDAQDLVQKIRALWQNEKQLASLGGAARQAVDEIPEDSFYQGLRTLCAELSDD